MPLRKLTTTEAFVVSDFADVPAVGIVRLAPKVLQRGAWEMARSATYQAALCQLKMSGASAGINSPADTKSDAAIAFVTELGDDLEQGRLFLSAGKGVPSESGTSLHAADQRPDDFLSQQATIRAASVVAAAAAAARGLDGKKVAIEGFGEGGAELAAAITARGGGVSGISTSAGFAPLPDALDATTLGSAWTQHGPAMVEHLSNGDDPRAAHMAFGADCDVLLVGSKMGALSHKGTEFVKATTVVAHSPVPYTTKAAVQLGRADRVLVPDVVSLSGTLHAAFSSPETEGADLVTRAAASTTSLVEGLQAHPDGLLLGAFLTAEDFMRTWRDDLPFGRPFAA